MTRGEIVEVVRSARAGRPSAGPRPAPVMLDAGDATVKLTWKHGGTSSVVRALRRALKAAQALERARDEDAA